MTFTRMITVQFPTFPTSLIVSQPAAEISLCPMPPIVFSWTPLSVSLFGSALVLLWQKYQRSTAHLPYAALPLSVPAQSATWVFILIVSSRWKRTSVRSRALATTIFRRLFQLRNLVSQKVMAQLVTSLILSRLDYCNSESDLPASAFNHSTSSACPEHCCASRSWSWSSLLYYSCTAQTPLASSSL